MASSYLPPHPPSRDVKRNDVGYVFGARCFRLGDGNYFGEMEDKGN
jgi:hypothetical protein